MDPVLAFLQDVNLGPEPGQELYWIAGLMASAIAALFWQLLKAKDDYAKSCVDDKKICMTALDGLNAATSALTNEMKHENANIARRQEEIIDRLEDIKNGPLPKARAR
jgi:hypothetical protein